MLYIKHSLNQLTINIIQIKHTVSHKLLIKMSQEQPIRNSVSEEISKIEEISKKADGAHTDESATPKDDAPVPSSAQANKTKPAASSGNGAAIADQVIPALFESQSPMSNIHSLTLTIDLLISLLY